MDFAYGQVKIHPLKITQKYLGKHFFYKGATGTAYAVLLKRWYAYDEYIKRDGRPLVVERHWATRPFHQKEWRFWGLSAEGIANSCVRYAENPYGYVEIPGCDLTRSWRAWTDHANGSPKEGRGPKWPGFGIGSEPYLVVQNAPQW